MTTLDEEFAYENLPELEKKIIDTAENMIEKVGYRKTSIRKIAEKLEISPGTVLYHFKDGKTEILLGIFRKSIKRFNLDKYLKKMEYNSFEEGLRHVLYRNLDLHRKTIEFSKAMEIELLSDYDSFSRILNILEPDLDIVGQYIRDFADKFPNKAEKMTGKETKIMFVLDALIHRHVNFRNFFGSDEDVINVLVKIALALINA